FSPLLQSPLRQSALPLSSTSRLTVCHSASSNPLPLILHLCGLPPLILPLCSRLSPLASHSLKYHLNLSFVRLCLCETFTLSLCECDLPTSPIATGRQPQPSSK
ncbi:hypothetical protein HAX54_046064, partial [Datura stramonium]|nr:hypothetical protein [Datura stramonium]